MSREYEACREIVLSLGAEVEVFAGQRRRRFGAEVKQRLIYKTLQDAA
jgi:hypothetical protein